MSFFDDASLVFLPSGEAGKDGKAYSMKPTNGNGDFTFSRGSNLTATRVDSNGLIEKGRENLLLQSNQFDTTWVKNPSNVSITSGFSGYDGSNNAWKLEAVSDNNYSVVNQLVSSTGVETFSVYAKAGTSNFFRIQVTGGTNTSASYFDLSGSGSVGINFNNIDAKIESVGNGWFRCSVTGNKTTSSNCVIFVLDADGSTNVTTGANIYIQDAQLEIGLTSTEYIESGATTGKAGILEDSPRFDYSGGASCPSLLLEGSRTNVVPYSEYFDGWNKGRSSVTSNAAVSPDGLVNASYFYDTTESGTHRLYTDTFSVTSGQSQSLTLYAKTGTFDKFRLSVKDISENDLAFGIFDFDLTAVTCSNSDGSIESMGNGWYKCTAVGDVNASVSARMFIYLINDSGVVTYVGTGNDYIQIYGAQCESNVSYATSYIPNHSGGSVTREADSCSGAGDASTFNDDEGVLYAEIAALANDGGIRYLSLSDGGSNNRVVILFDSSADRIRAIVSSGGVKYFDDNTQSYDVLDFHKIAVRYKRDDFSLWVDGTNVASVSSGSSPIGLNELSYNLGGSSTIFSKSKQLIVFNSFLSDVEMITLTS